MTHIRLPANLKYLHAFLSFIREYAGTNGVDAKDLSRMELVVEEALANIIRHAFARQNGEIEVRLENGDDGCLMVEIRDTGMPFDPCTYTEPNRPAMDVDERKAGSLSVHLMHTMTDSLAYRREGDTNILTIRF